MGQFEGKVALLTGAGSGIARAAAKMFAADGAKVVIGELKPELGKATEAAIREAGGDAFFIQTDVTQEESVRAMVRGAVERYGRLDVLNCSAGGSGLNDTTVTDVDLSVWQHTMDLDLKGTFLCCRHVIPEMIRSGGGSIINMTTWRALMGGLAHHVYITAKGGVISLTKTLAAEYVQHHIRVNAIAPGAIRTERTINKWTTKEPADPARMKQLVEYRTKLAERFPYSIGQPEDVANIIVFLASDKSRLINGAIIPAEGGRSAYH